MDIVVTPKNDSIDFVLDLLRSSGVSSVFIDEIDKQRSDFSDLAVFIVERVNRTSGKRVSFGLQPSGKFIDDKKTRRKLGIPSLHPDARYTYYAKLCLRPPESLMKSVFAKFSTPATPGVDNKEALAQKFLSAYTNQFGNSPGGALPSSAELVNGISIGDSLRAGNTGVVLDTEISTPDRRPVPVAISVRTMRRGKKLVRLTWESSEGDASQVDYCLVFADVAGQRICLGTVPCDEEMTKFRFTDQIYAQTPGKVTYSVRYVYKDMTMSPFSREKSIFNLSYTPKNLLMGSYLGVKQWL